MQFEQNVPFKSKRAMTTAALFTDIFHKYLDRHTCENIPLSNEEELGQFSSEILDHVIIVGGFCRDILLNRPINDIDIIINLRELCKLQTNHLKKYHSKKEDQDRNIRCVYWQRYLERFSDEDTNETQSTNKEMVMMHNLNYIFNCSFWLKILKMDELLNNKLSVKDVPAHGFVSAQIVNTVKYGNVNLDQQSIDFIDTFTIDQCYGDSFVSNYAKFNTFHRKSRQLSMSGINIDRKDLEDTNRSKWGTNTAAEQKGNKSRPEHNDDDDDDDHDAHHGHHHNHAAHKQKSRLKSMAIIEFDIDDLGGDFGNFGVSEAQNLSRPEYIAIEIPIYSGKVRYKLLNYDFSINTAIIPLSNIINLKEHNNEYMNDNETMLVDAPMTWLEIIENGLGECDAIQDVQVHKILKCPESNHETCTIQAHPIAFVFWRCVQWMIRDSSFKLDKNLIVAIIKDYNQWLTLEYFDKRKKRETFMGHLLDLLQNECCSTDDVQQMLSTLNALEFNTKFINVLNENQTVRHSLMDAIHSIKNDNVSNSEIIDLFKQYQYPIEAQLFKIPSKTEEKLEKVTARKIFLETELENKSQRIQDLEKQNDRLLKEVQYLQQLNKENDRVQDLEQQNSRLLQELHVINDSKVSLALNANKTIDELRKYLLEYQALVLHFQTEQK